MSDMPTPRTDEAWIDPETGLMLNRDVAGLIRMMFVSRQLERELAEARVALQKSLFECDQIEARFRQRLRIRDSEIRRAMSALTAITSSRFYQSSCLGGEMERLMNQAIEALKGNQ